jgi:hypothetical protein
MSVSFDWSELREKILDTLAKLLVLNIQKLWDPPIAEEQFVMLVMMFISKLGVSF